MPFNSSNRFDFVKHRNKFFAFSIVITVIGLLTYFILGLNYGVDFRAGTSLDITTGATLDKAAVEQVMAEAGYTPPIVTIGGDGNNRISARFDTVLSAEDIGKIIAAIKAAYGDQVSYEENTVDPTIALELGQKAAIAIAAASLCIIVYVSIRFEWRFAIAAIVALFHDAFIVISIFSIFRLEVNLPFVAAILTIIGYSINDTIVIFDRIRENMRFAKIRNMDELSKLVNDSIWQTMTRSINTMLTVLIAAACLLVLGSESIRLFSLAMTLGTISGVYSTICIASQLWVLLKKNDLNKKKAQAASAS